jgi:serine/threonine-protein kinase
MLAPGDRVGPYVVIGALGEGGMGQVVVAEDPRLGRRVALKVLRREAAGDSRAVARMFREARIVAALNHPNVVTVHDVGEIDGLPFLAMELVEGKTLRAYVGSSASVGDRITWLADLARGLAAAHRAGVVHRDVKPENVLVRDGGGTKVLDFGIARPVTLGAVGVTPPADGATFEGALVGTPAYMSPEALRGDEVDGRADQFSWGVTAYELLAGHLPFAPGKPPVHMIAAILAPEPPPPLTGVPSEVAAVVARALSKSRADRFASMDDVVAALTMTTTGNTSEVPTLPDVPRLRPRARRGAAFAALGVAALVGLAATIVLRSPRVEAPPAPSASVRPVPTTMLDLPSPLGAADAISAYRLGLRAWRDSSWPLAYEHFRRAATLDPELAAAYLRAAIVGHARRPRAETQRDLERTRALRDRLSPRDRALLHAIEPWLGTDPPDHVEAARRLELLRDQSPGDAELALFSGYLGTVGAPALLAHADAALALDPDFGDALQMRAWALNFLGREAEARASLERCVDSGGSGTDCLRNLASLAERSGRCEQMELTARKWLTRHGDSWEAAYWLAVALEARHAPAAAVAAAVEQSIERSPEARRPLVAALRHADLAMLAGDFDVAERAAQEASRIAATSEFYADHATAALSLCGVLAETGHDREAAKIARGVRAGGAAWRRLASGGEYDDVALATYERAGGLLSDAEFSAWRSDWVARVAASLAPSDRGWAWVAGYVRPATSVTDARSALDARAALEPVPPPGFDESFAAPLGHALALAGRTEEALPYLRAAAAECSALRRPRDATRASAWLGEALETTGDREGACASYRVVLDRWGQSRRSVTARAAEARARTLGCPAAPARR